MRRRNWGGGKESECVSGSAMQTQEIVGIRDVHADCKWKENTHRIVNTYRRRRGVRHPHPDP